MIVAWHVINEDVRRTHRILIKYVYLAASSNLDLASCCPKAPLIKGTSQSLGWVRGSEIERKNQDNGENRDRTGRKVKKEEVANKESRRGQDRVQADRRRQNKQWKTLLQIKVQVLAYIYRVVYCAVPCCTVLYCTTIHSTALTYLAILSSRLLLPSLSSLTVSSNSSARTAFASVFSFSCLNSSSARLRSRTFWA